MQMCETLCVLVHACQLVDNSITYMPASGEQVLCLLVFELGLSDHGQLLSICLRKCPSKALCMFIIFLFLELQHMFFVPDSLLSCVSFSMEVTQSACLHESEAVLPFWSAAAVKGPVSSSDFAALQTLRSTQFL